MNRINELIMSCPHEICEWEPGTVVVRQRARNGSLFVILDGELEVWAEQRDRSDRIATARAGDVVGELSFLEPGAATATLRVSRRSRALQLRHEDLAPLWTTSPRVARALHAWVLQLVAGRLREATCELFESNPSAAAGC